MKDRVCDIFGPIDSSGESWGAQNPPKIRIFPEFLHPEFRYNFLSDAVCDVILALLLVELNKLVDAMAEWFQNFTEQSTQ